MGANPYKDLVIGSRLNKSIHEATFEAMPTFDTYYYYTKGSLFPKLGEAIEIKLKLPPGHFEIEAIVRLFNNNTTRKHYGASLHFFLDDKECNVWEGGEIGDSRNSPPYLVTLKAMTTSKKSKEVRLTVGTNASSAFIAENASLLIKRVGAMVHKID